MLRNYYINREWLLSETARRVYRAASTATVLFFAMIISVGLVDHVPENLLPFIKGFVLLGVLGTAITVVAMEYFMVNFDTSSAMAKTVWFCVMLLPFVGAPLYCFLVYSRAEAFRKAASAASFSKG